MWRDNLLRIIKEKNVTLKHLSEISGISEKTILRIIKDPNKTTYLDTVDRLAIGLGCSLSDIVQDTKVVLGNESLDNLQKQLEIVTAERDLLKAENAILKDNVTALTAEINMLKMQLMHKEELLALHNYYNKLTPNK